ncbi:hypothetical protein SS50377_26741 [Spironucleus salmonicida]|uniref:Uncharacterized protein n=1 Tax=Spironucleus salmonicida TaxID=348837 RepID=V6LZP3_9EUKA|nr:hypothetical protein SS50377_26741 [Spironucleus salmonicida]|eukprot:EST49211.1 Hypothetical protein SS50377_10430 [Spironucleus salmonicida]
MNRKSLSQQPSQVLHITQAIQTLITVLPQLKFNPTTLAEQKLYEKYQNQIQHKLSVIKNAALTSPAKTKFQFLQLPHYLDTLVASLTNNARTGSLALQILQIHALDSQLADHGILLHQNLTGNLKNVFVGCPETQRKIVVLISQLAASNYNLKVLLYDENVVFILQNSLRCEVAPEEFQGLFECWSRTVQALVQFEREIAHMLFSDVLIDFVCSCNDEEYVQQCIQILWEFYQENNIFEEEILQIQRIVEAVQGWDNEVIQAFIGYVSGLIAEFVEDDLEQIQLFV